MNDVVIPLEVCNYSFSVSEVRQVSKNPCARYLARQGFYYKEVDN